MRLQEDRQEAVTRTAWDPLPHILPSGLLGTKSLLSSAEALHFSLHSQPWSPPSPSATRLTPAWENLAPLHNGPALQQKGPLCVEPTKGWDSYAHFSLGEA